MRQTVYPKEAGSPWNRRLGNAIGVIFDIGIRCLYQIEVRGLEHFSRVPSTLVVSNHRRDSDGPIIASVLLQRRNLRIHGVRSCFVAREDLFRRGFLSEYLDRWPSPLRAALSTLNLGPFLTFMQAFPMRRVPERSLREVLEEVLRVTGNVPLDEVLKPSWVEQFQRLSNAEGRPLHVQEVLAWRYRRLLFGRYGLAKLTRRCFRELLPYERGVIESQLQYFTRLLERGVTLVLEPEGVVSVDGRFARLRAALHALVNRPGTTPRVLPMGVTYDCMTDGRQRIFVNIGPEISNLRGMSRRETDERVAGAIRAQLTVTCSQLASQFLFTARGGGECVVTDSELDAYVHQEANRYARQGCHVDQRLLTASQRRRRLKGYIASCVRQGILLRSGNQRYYVSKAAEDANSGLSRPGGIIGYMSNELSASADVYPA